MRTRVVSAAFLLAALVLLAGCGGDGGSQDGANGGAPQQQQGENTGAKKKDAPERKIAIGTIKFVNADTQRFTLQPGEGERMEFRYNENTRVSLDGEEAQPDAIQKDRQAQVEYITRNDLNRALAVELFANGGAGEATGG